MERIEKRKNNVSSGEKYSLVETRELASKVKKCKQEYVVATRTNGRRKLLGSKEKTPRSRYS